MNLVTVVEDMVAVESLEVGSIVYGGRLYGWVQVEAIERDEDGTHYLECEAGGSLIVADRGRMFPLAGTVTRLGFLAGLEAAARGYDCRSGEDVADALCVEPEGLASDLEWEHWLEAAERGLAIGRARVRAFEEGR